MRYRLTVGALLSILLTGVTHAADYHPIADVTVTTAEREGDLWPVSNLIQGPGVGFDAEEPHTQNVGGADNLWVTNADAGFPADYIEDVEQPVIQLDLGVDRSLKEISVWGYSSTNANGTSQFSLRFATAAEGGADGIAGTVNYGDSITYNPTFELTNDAGFGASLPQQYKLFSEHVTARYVEFTNLDNFFIAPGQNPGPEPGQEVLPRLLPFLPGGDRVGFGEVAFMDLPESFQPGDKLTRKIAGDEFGTLNVGSSLTDVEISDLGPKEGLAQLWFEGNVTDPEVFNFDLGPEDNDTNPLLNPGGTPIATLGTWWDGPGDLTANGRSLPDYPPELIGTKFEGVSGADQYSVKLTGEIFIESNGTYIFRDTVDDFTMLAVDLDGNGELDGLEDLAAADVGIGGEIDDVLILDNAWAAVNGGQSNDNAFGTFEGIAAGGEWRSIEIWTSEGGGGDSGTVFMAKDDDPDLWNVDAAEVLTQDQIDKFLIPDSKLRTDSAVAVTNADSVSDPIPNRDTHGYVVQVGADGNDQIVADDLSIGLGTSSLDVSETTVSIQVEGEITEGTEFQIFVADEVTGLEDGFTLLFDDESLWNTSKLSQGIIIFEPSSPCDPNSGGDLDGNGKVEFADFLVLSGNFGKDVDSEAEGDIDCNGKVEFADFLVLSGNFGKDVGGAESVPEPTGLALLGLAALFGGFLRRRR